MIKNIIFLLSSLLPTFIVAQSTTQLGEPHLKIQPSIIVIPFARADQDLRTIYEQQHGGSIRAAITRVKDDLDKSGIKTIDFRAVLKQASSDKAITSEQQQSIKQRVIELSTADIYIESETQIIRTPTGNSVTVILTAYDAFTGLSLVNKLGHSPKFYTENYEKLTERALDTFLEKFTIELKESIDDMLQNGRSIAIDIGISGNSKIDMDSEIQTSGDLLSDMLEQWFDENAIQGQFHIQGITATKMIIDAVKIPMFDPVTKKNYRPSTFANSLRKFLISQGLETTRDIQGAKIFITISG